MELPRNEIAFRKEYENGVLLNTLTTVFRPGNRMYPNWRGYKLGEVVTARIIEKCGCDEKEIPPLFNDHKVKVQISGIETVNIEELQDEDFLGSSDDVHDVESLKEHLAYIYGKPISDYDNKITRINLAYISDR